MDAHFQPVTKSRWLFPYINKQTGIVYYAAVPNKSVDDEYLFIEAWQNIGDSSFYDQ